MTSWHSYASIFNFGHRALQDVMGQPFFVEEKVDGSQFSFGLIDGELKCRSKGATVHMDAPEGMFKRAVATVRELAPLLTPEWTYRGEYLEKPKHNALAYDRIPARHIVLFDVNTDEEAYLMPREKRAEAARLGLECVPVLYEGVIAEPSVLLGLLATPSMLGGQLIEGVVAKQYLVFGQDKKALMAKYVSEAFKEVHKKEWKKSNPGRGDILETLTAAYAQQTRWNKAIQHLRESGRLDESVRDIGPLIKEVCDDVERECAAEIADALYKWGWPQVRRGLTRGLPEWYKERLLAGAFSEAAP